jgi:hypothetical protein
MKVFFALLNALIILCATIPAEDMQKYLATTQEMARQGKYKEALERHIWFHDHALEQQPSIYGVRLSFALGYWQELGDKYPPAKKAFIETRDRKTRRIMNGTGDAALFSDVAAFNETLQEEKKTLALFEFLDKENPALAKRCWHEVKNSVISSRRFDLARRYLHDLIGEFARIKLFYDQNVAHYDDPRMSRGIFQPYNENNFVEDSLRLIQVAVAWKDLDSAREIQKRALACIHDERLEKCFQNQ